MKEGGGALEKSFLRNNKTELGTFKL